MRLLIMATATFALAGCSSVQNQASVAIAAPAVSASHTQAAITHWARENEFTGVIAVQYPDGPSTTLAFGMADRDGTRPLGETSRFQTGSVGKYFIAIAAFALADEGLLDIDAPIGQYLPESDATSVTVAHLLANRSGISQAPLFPYMMQVARLRSEQPDIDIADIPDLPEDMDAAISLFLEEDLLFEPGSEFDYANSNWIIAARVLEAASGQTLETVLQRYVFEPAGMTNSGVFIDRLDADQASNAIGYNPDSQLLDTDFPLPAFIGGGTYTAAGDMLALMQSLHRGDLLSDEGLTRFSQVQTPEENYAFGGRIVAGENAPANGYSWQSGSNGATNMVTVFNRDTGYSFAALSNRAHSQAEMFDLALALEEESLSGT